MTKVKKQKSEKKMVECFICGRKQMITNPPKMHDWACKKCVEKFIAGLNS